jgi:hypothetical protein
MRPVIVVSVLAAVALAVAVASRYGAGRLDGAVAATIERHGSALTGTDVEVGAVDLALTAGRADIAGLTIDNPSGYDTDYAVRIGRASVALDVASLTGDVPVIEELTLDDALINAEQRDTASNLTDIQRHATSSSGGEGEGAAADPGRIVIERFRVRNARVLLTSPHLREAEELPLRDILVENVGSAAGGATYSEAAEALLAPVLAEARSAAAARLRSVAADAAADAVREELDEHADEAREEVEELENEVKDRVDELLDRRPTPRARAAARASRCWPRHGARARSGGRAPRSPRSGRDRRAKPARP